MAADVAGYAKLMEADEWATVTTLEAYRAVFRERVAGHRGRIVDTAGDSVLAVFPCPVSAVEAAIKIQEELDGRNRTLPKDLRMRFRLGVNLGDVIEGDDGSVYGSEVNVAARIESLAEPGGTTVSEVVHRHVRGKINIEFEDIGEHRVKNIAKPVRAFSISSRRAGRLSDVQSRAGGAHA